VYNGRQEEALEVLARVNGEHRDSASVQVQYREIIDTLEFEKTAGRGVGFREAARNPPNRRRVLLAMSVAPLVMLAGSNVIT
jgi:prolyl oligopeptidase PreP (S9A serine peptidase family)